MKRAFLTAVTALMALSLTAPTSANNDKDREGVVTYSLPTTVITLDVAASQESFHAGPYAKFADKYLGIKARQKDEVTVQVTSIKLTPRVEADQSRRYSLQVPKGEVDGNLFKLCSAGLVTFTDATFGEGVQWRFPQQSKADFAGKGVSSNLTSESTTLYRNQKKESAYSKVAVQQSMVVEKSIEKKASEAAQTIFKLRQKRLQIVTGDTDATYSGAAMGSALEELVRLEEEYMSLFVGYSESRTMSMSFDIIPDASAESQMYIAFRVSDTAGLLPADNLSGKPVLMEIIPQSFVEAEPSVTAKKAEKNKKLKTDLVHYRIPSVCTVKIMDGMNLLLQTRVPVYQLGRESSLPANIKVK